MAKEVVWNKRAIAKLDEVVDYLLANASEDAARTFYEHVLERVEVVRRYSEIDRRSAKRW